MANNDFDPIAAQLHKGISLIEASAGTGKTYTIAMLVLRLVVEQDIPIDKILVVTFTKAATEELKDRIRSRLVDAKRILLGHDDSPDVSIINWLAQLNLSKEVINRRLTLALLDIDQAGVFTIHGFCQRALKEHALASGQLFDAELTDDLAAIKQTCADDFWRRQIQTRSAWEVAVLSKDFNSPDALLSSVDFVSADILILPQYQSIDDCLQHLKSCFDNAKEKITPAIQKVAAHTEGSLFKKTYKDSFAENSYTMTEWLNSNSLNFPNNEALTLLTYQGILDNLNGTQFRSNQSQTSDERKAEFFASLVLDTKPFDDLAEAARQISITLRRNLLETLNTELDKQLEQANLWSFDNLITHLAKALQGEQAQHLTNELRQRFSVALIDEFQDTDNNQWHIFSSVFAVQSHYLVLVGDPKQAIYKFRGADIYSYLTAQAKAHHHYTLGFNWRSHPHLVTAVNCLFQRQNAFLLSNITFKPTQAARTINDGGLYLEAASCPPLMLWQLPENISKSGFWQTNRNDAADQICVAVVNEIVTLLTYNYRLQPQNRKLVPQDIAILVRTNRQAKDYQAVLRNAGVPAVLNNTESVFASEEAIHLLTLLKAIAHPGDVRLLGQALALTWFGFDGQSLYRILNDEVELEKFLTRFANYYQLWQQKGIMTMMQLLLNQERIAATLASSSLSERRLTNLQHLLELLQEAVIDEKLGLHKTLYWLTAAITEAQNNSSGTESQQLRLESDANAIKIITMHRSKGLEYPVVFCPLLWQRKQANNTKYSLVKYHLPHSNMEKDNRLVVDLGSAELAQHQAQADFEDRAEELRLAYVAVTRAKYRCYVAWANARTEAEPNDSALAYLLDFTDQNFSQQQQALQALVAQHEQMFGYRLLDVSETIVNSYDVSDTLKKLSAKKLHRSLYTHWQMSSYTALSALSLSETPEIPLDKAGENQSIPVNTNDLLPSGAHTGNVIHHLLENIPFLSFVNKNDVSAERNTACLRYGLKLAQPEIIENLLYKTVTTPLSGQDNNFCLMNIPEQHCLKEMPFYLSLSAFNTRRVNEILSSQSAFQALTHKQMSGFMTGFIDLICCYKNRYYVMDYKTNTLPDYRIDTLTQAMKEHNYGLQYWLYCVVLHRYLQSRLTNYNYAEHFGGVRYLFVRGMESNLPMSGVFEDTPDLVTLESLAALFKESS